MNNRRLEILSKTLTAITAGLMALGLTSCDNRLKVETSHMSPTILQNERVEVVREPGYEPTTCDVVLIRVNEPVSYEAVFRVIALEGDILDYDDEGQLLVNGLPPRCGRGLKWFMPNQEGYVESNITTPLQVDEGMVFVVGDNQVKSYDSRSYGPVPASNIVGVIREKSPAS
jgi:signal peptidase I